MKRKHPHVVGPHTDAGHEAIRAYLVRRTLETKGGAPVPSTLALLAGVVLIPLLLSLLAIAVPAVWQLITWR